MKQTISIQQFKQMVDKAIEKEKIIIERYNIEFQLWSGDSKPTFYLCIYCASGNYVGEYTDPNVCIGIAIAKCKAPFTNIEVIPTANYSNDTEA